MGRSARPFGPIGLGPGRKRPKGRTFRSQSLGKSAWETAILEEDVISVMQQIIDAHTFIATGTTSTFGEQMQSRVEFATIKLHSNENIASFNQRFNDILKSLKDKGIENEYTAKTIMFCYLKPLCSYSHKEIAYKCIDYLSIVEDEDKFPTDLLEMQRSFYNKEHTINEHTANKAESNKFTTVNNVQMDDEDESQQFIMEDSIHLMM